jgi:hypothetical protein
MSGFCLLYDALGKEKRSFNAANSEFVRARLSYWFSVDISAITILKGIAIATTSKLVTVLPSWVDVPPKIFPIGSVRKSRVLIVSVEIGALSVVFAIQLVHNFLPIALELDLIPIVDARPQRLQPNITDSLTFVCETNFSTHLASCDARNT